MSNFNEIKLEIDKKIFILFQIISTGDINVRMYA